MVGRILYAESCEQEGRCDHVADAAYFELCRVLRLDSTLELCLHIVTEFRENGWHGLRRHLWPEIMGRIEQRHQSAGWSVHVQDASG
jgi:hypothetical protein